MSDTLTPVQIESKLRSLVTELTLAQTALRDARDREVAARHAYESVKRHAMFADGCPKVTRGGVTTAERDAWIDLEAAPEQRLYDIAEAGRKAAEDHLRVVRDQSMIVMSLGRSVNAAYAMAGAS